jgi:hypothetical protein
LSCFFSKIERNHRYEYKLKTLGFLGCVNPESTNLKTTMGNLDFQAPQSSTSHPFIAAHQPLGLMDLPNKP